VPERIHSATVCVTDIADFDEFVRRYSSTEVTVTVKHAYAADDNADDIHADFTGIVVVADVDVEADEDGGTGSNAGVGIGAYANVDVNLEADVSVGVEVDVGEGVGVNIDVDAIVGTVVDGASNKKVCELSEPSVVHFKFLGTIFFV